MVEPTQHVRTVPQPTDRNRSITELGKETMSDDENDTWSQEAISPPLPNLAVVTKWDDRFIVEFDYEGDGNYRPFHTHKEARKEAMRLWSNGQASHIEDRLAVWHD